MPHPNSPTSFEGVIQATQALLNQIEHQSLAPEQIKAEVIHLLELEKGPRGFFATFLTDSRAIADDPPETLLSALKSLPKGSLERLAKNLVQNLAMSTAMIVFHQRQDDDKASEGSKQVQRRVQSLIQALKLEQTHQELKALLESTSQDGPYSQFLARWNYDAEQIDAIAAITRTTLS